MIFNDINGNNKNGNSKHSNNDFDKIIMLIIEQQIMMILLTMMDNYSPKWRIVVDIYPTAKQQGKCLPFHQHSVAYILMIATITNTTSNNNNNPEILTTINIILVRN